MTKPNLDKLVANMKKAGIVTKATPWLKEEYKNQACDARYIGIKIDETWPEFLSGKDQFLIKFVHTRSESIFQLFLANKSPFIFITQTEINPQDKWEYMLGKCKNKLNRDYTEAIKGNPGITNVYEKIKIHLK
mgnify:CR=1 FL=1